MSFECNWFRVSSFCEVCVNCERQIPVLQHGFVGFRCWSHFQSKGLWFCEWSAVWGILVRFCQGSMNITVSMHDWYSDICSVVCICCVYAKKWLCESVGIHILLGIVYFHASYEFDPTNIMSLFLIGHLYYWSPISTMDAKHMLRRDWTTCKNEVTIRGSRVDTQKNLPLGLSSILHLYIVLKFGMTIFVTLSWQLILQIY